MFCYSSPKKRLKNQCLSHQYSVLAILYPSWDRSLAPIIWGAPLMTESGRSAPASTVCSTCWCEVRVWVTTFGTCTTSSLFWCLWSVSCVRKPFGRLPRCSDLGRRREVWAQVYPVGGICLFKHKAPIIAGPGHSKPRRCGTVVTDFSG